MNHSTSNTTGFLTQYNNEVVWVGQKVTLLNYIERK